jgi:hypothetical protein
MLPTTELSRPTQSPTRAACVTFPRQSSGKLLEDRFCLSAGNDVARKLWTDLEIPCQSVSAVELADRTVSTFEGIAGGIKSRQLNQKNNIHFSFLRSDGPALLRVEMLTGVTVMGQAKKCQEFDDRLWSHQIRERFGMSAVPSSPHAAQHASVTSAADELAKLAALRDQGILSDDEFPAGEQASWMVL